MARFSIPQLEAFHWLAELGTFKAVSERLNLSQPTVTTRIRELERELGVTLVDRRAGRSVPNRFGRTLLEDVRGILHHVDRIADASFRPFDDTATVRFGIPDTLARTHLVGMTSAVSDADARIRLAIDVDHSERLYGKVLNEELDFALIASDRLDAAVTSFPLCEISLAWAQPVSVATIPTADPEVLARQTVITMQAPSNLHSYTMEWLGEHRPRSIIICNSLSCIVELIGGGHGIGIVPVALIEQLGFSQRIAVVESNRTLAPDRVDLVFKTSSADRGHAVLLAECCAAALVREPREGIRRVH